MGSHVGLGATLEDRARQAFSEFQSATDGELEAARRKRFRSLIAKAVHCVNERLEVSTVTLDWQPWGVNDQNPTHVVAEIDGLEIVYRDYDWLFPLLPCPGCGDRHPASRIVDLVDLGRLLETPRLLCADCQAEQAASEEVSA